MKKIERYKEILRSLSRLENYLILVNLYEAEEELEDAFSRVKELEKIYYEKLKNLTN